MVKWLMHADHRLRQPIELRCDQLRFNLCLIGTAYHGIGLEQSDGTLELAVFDVELGHVNQSLWPTRPGCQGGISDIAHYPQGSWQYCSKPRYSDVELQMITVDPASSTIPDARSGIAGCWRSQRHRISANSQWQLILLFLLKSIRHGAAFQ